MSPALTPEQRARRKIDAALAESDWVVQDLEDANLSAAQGVAVREVTLRAGHGADSGGAREARGAKSQNSARATPAFADNQVTGLRAAIRAGKRRDVSGSRSRIRKAASWARKPLLALERRVLREIAILRARKPLSAPGSRFLAGIAAFRDAVPRSGTDSRVLGRIAAS